MNFKELMKKYWFICVIGVALIAFIGIYSVDAYKNRELTVQSKQIDGKYAVYSVDGEYVFADDFFDSLYLQNGANCALNKFINAVTNKAYETTDEIKEYSSNMAYNMYANYSSNLDYLASQLVALGYVNGIDDIETFAVDQLKRLQMEKDYADANWTELYGEYPVETEQPRMVYHILIKVADVTSSTDADGNAVYTPNPTAEEQAKIDAVLAALKEGKDFLEVQEEYNEDGSNLPYFVDVSNTSSLAAPFLDASIELEAGKVSDLVATSYGYHIIKNMGEDKALFLENNTFISQLYTYNSNAFVKALMSKADELGFKLVDEELSNYINTQLEDHTTGESEDTE